MLVEFRVRNFRAFRDEQRLSMVASSDKQLLKTNTTQIKALKDRLTQSAVIYGPNTSGKSTIIMAIGFLHLLMLRATSSAPTSGRRALDHPLLRPFLFDVDHQQGTSEFECTFIQTGIRYQYGLVLDRVSIHEEWLIAFPKGQPQTWFERRLHPNVLRTADETSQHALSDAQGGSVLAQGSPRNLYTWYFGPRLAGEKQRLANLTRADVPFLAAAATFGNMQLQEVFAWFAQGLAVLNPWGRPDLLSETAHLAMNDPKLRNQLRNLLAQADIGITDISVRRVNVDDSILGLPEELRKAMSGLDVEQVEIMMRHRAGKVPEGYLDLPVEDESLGTLRLFAIAGPIINALEQGQVLVVDEIDDSLHPLLVRRLIELFHNPTTNPNGAQLIINTHDTTLLDTRLFRRDQIWFTEKDSEGAARLYPLSDYSPRSEEALSKGYLHGRYGAVPFLDHLGVGLGGVPATDVTAGGSTEEAGNA